MNYKLLLPGHTVLFALCVEETGGAGEESRRVGA